MVYILNRRHALIGGVSAMALAAARAANGQDIPKARMRIGLSTNSANSAAPMLRTAAT